MFQKSFNLTFLLDFSDISSETCLNTMGFLMPLCYNMISCIDVRTTWLAVLMLGQHV